MEDPDFLSFGLPGGKTVAPLEISSIVGRCFFTGGRGFIEWPLDGEDMIIDHGAGDERPSQFRCYTNSEHNQGENKSIFRCECVFK
ncbi:hypothetical protein D3C77_434030 [compost metagenome]